ncbi:MAG: GNAT family N-acetyltransferase [Chloroflexi bacterium]|jgi:hypothetical protein|nr:GNAT family N-acetyltransferase [Chloroflexota bacterium]MBT7080908.1 GNAT family N-acetyltransferase [Chloroflexota bacterium]MBT7289071.1 GNAT family N-acetyltransferase [Chloroflexota bacterium]
MNNTVNIVNVDESNIDEHPPVCFLNPKNVGYQTKREWLAKRFAEGMKIKLLYLEGEKKPVGFIEYVPGEYAWRAVDAAGYMFIHCIWITPNKYKEKGYASIMIDECLKDAKAEGKYGVAVITSEGAFMAGKDLFLKNGFASIASAKPSFELMCKTIKEGPLPQFRDWQKQLDSYQGLNIVCSNQCPWVARFMSELDDTIKGMNLDIKIIELETAAQAQNAPSIYATFNMINNGKLLSDHYISNTRFMNIINKELGKKGK